MLKLKVSPSVIVPKYLFHLWSPLNLETNIYPDYEGKRVVLVQFNLSQISDLSGLILKEKNKKIKLIERIKIADFPIQLNILSPSSGLDDFKLNHENFQITLSEYVMVEVDEGDALEFNWNFDDQIEIERESKYFKQYSNVDSFFLFEMFLKFLEPYYSPNNH